MTHSKLFGFNHFFFNISLAQVLRKIRVLVLNYQIMISSFHQMVFSAQRATNGPEQNLREENFAKIQLCKQPKHNFTLQMTIKRLKKTFRFSIKLVKGFISITTYYSFFTIGCWHCWMFAHQHPKSFVFETCVVIISGFMALHSLISAVISFYGPRMQINQEINQLRVDHSATLCSF